MPGFQFIQLPPRSLLCTSYTNPAGALMLATVTLNVVPAGPEGGLALIFTEIVPTIPRPEWKVQWYLYWPPAVKTKSNAPPGGTDPESHNDSGVSPVEVWLVVAAPFVQWTVPPMTRPAFFGVSTEFVMETLTVAAR